MLGIFAILATDLQMAIHTEDWRLCIDSNSGVNLPNPFAYLTLGLKLVADDPKTLAFEFAVSLPYLLIIAVTRSRFAAILATAMLLLGAVIIPFDGPGHTCDQKGCYGCANLMIIQLFILLPLGLFGLVMVGVMRALDYCWQRIFGVTVR
jgi:hypothetical protein